MMHTYEVRPRKDNRGVDLISNVLAIGRLCHGGRNPVSDAIGYATHYSRSQDAGIFTNGIPSDSVYLVVSTSQQ
jgi:hypothetical protein